ncbi:MAG: carbohydrate kinase [Nocardioidaceae bacterium]
MTEEAHVFTVLGEALLDMVQPSPGDTYRALPAGGPLNIAVGLRRLGHPTAMMARFSSGALGGRVRQFALDSDLDLSASVSTDQQATLAFATVDDNGRAAYDFFVREAADWGWTPDELAGLPGVTQAVHTGSLATAIEPGAGVIVDWWDTLSRDGVVLLSFDPNIRPALVGPRESAVRRVETLVSRAHVVKASDEDLSWLYPDVDPADTIRRWSRLGPSLAVLTRGPGGCLGVTRDSREVDLGPSQVVVVDTIGAGDAFQSGLLSALADADRLSPESVSSLSEDDVRRALERAQAVAALTCERAGASPPTRAEYDAFTAGPADGSAQPPTSPSADGQDR